MKKINYVFLYFPISFFVFLVIFISVKFIFIFFFRASYEPEFISFLTPYYILSGVNNQHLTVLSIIIITINVYLHVKINKKNLLLSFIPTGIMLTGLGFKIATSEITISNFLHYLIFGCLLFIVLIDHKQILIYPEFIQTPKNDTIITKKSLTKPSIKKILTKRTEPFIIRNPLKLKNIDKNSAYHNKTINEFKNLIEVDLNRTKTVLGELEKKSKKIIRLDKEIEERRKKLVEQEKLFKHRLISTRKKEIDTRPNTEYRKQISIEKIKSERTKQYQEILAKIDESAAIIQRGVLKQVNRPFVDLLNYNINELLEKNLFDFVVPERLSDVEKYYIKRLKGESISSYETIFLTGDNKKINVEISIKPIKYNGEKLNMAIIKNIEDIEDKNVVKK